MRYVFSLYALSQSFSPVPAMTLRLSFLNQPGKRYISFNNLVRSEAFRDIPENSTVYIPDYTGIHNRMDYSELYADIITDKKVKMVNDEKMLEGVDTYYIVRYIEELQLTLLFKAAGNH